MTLCRVNSPIFFTDTATTNIYPLSLHDALPISHRARREGDLRARRGDAEAACGGRALRHRGDAFGEPARARALDRKSTRLNSSHSQSSYAVFCLKKKKKNHTSWL